jgi:hypothetical protein
MPESPRTRHKGRHPEKVNGRGGGGQLGSVPHELRMIWLGGPQHSGSCGCGGWFGPDTKGTPADLRKAFARHRRKTPAELRAELATANDRRRRRQRTK